MPVDVGRPRPRVVMLMRGSIRNHPRVGKEARTLIDAGCQVIIVGVKVPGEAATAERLGRRLVALRTETRLLSRMRRRLGLAPMAVEATGEESSRIPRHRLLLMMVSRLLLAVKMAWLVRRARPDVVHAHDFSTLVPGWLGARLTGVPLVYDAHEVNLSREGYYQQLVPLIAFIEGCLIRRCNRVITTTSVRARHFRRVYRLDRTPTVIQNRPRQMAVSLPVDIRVRFGISDLALVCIYQGGLQEGRGLRNMIRTVAASDGVHLVILGDGPQAGLLEELARRLGSSNRVHFHPKVPFSEVPAITAAADVGLQLLRNTSFNHWSTDSNKLFEYVQAGLAVVASDFPEIRRVVQQHQVGVLVDPHDVDVVSEAIQTLRDDRSRLLELKSRARDCAGALCWRTEEPALLHVYEELGVLSNTEPLAAADR